MGRSKAKVRTQRVIPCGAESVLLPQTLRFLHALENLKPISQLIHKLIETRLRLIVRHSHAITYILGRTFI